MIKKKSMNIFERAKLKKAKDLGSEAFKLGIKRMPCLDKELEDMVKKEDQHEKKNEFIQKLVRRLGPWKH